MKNLIYLMVLVLTMTTQAQDVIDLEAAILIVPNTDKILIQDNYQAYTVTEKARQEFALDPIAFQRKNFDILEYINYFKDENLDTYYVTFKSSNGRLEVQFDKNGKLKRNSQWFSNVDLPREIKNQLHQEHNGWVMTKNKYFSKGSEDKTEKAVYRIKLENGNKTRKIKITPDLQEEIVVAEN